MNKEKIDDMDYYEKYLLNATKEERDCYIKEHPDFMNEYPVSYEHRESEIMKKVVSNKKLTDHNRNRMKFLMDRKCFVWFVSLF